MNQNSETLMGTVNKFLKTLIFTLPMWLITLVLITRLNFSDKVMNIASLSVYFFINLLFFMMIYTQKIDKYRSILFVTTAVSFPISFISTLYALRGDFMVLSKEQINACAVPFCHIVIPQTIISALFNREIIFPGAFSGFQYTISSMIIIWIVFTLALGRGWCSWACFYGGWEDGCSRLRKKPLVKNLPRKLTLLPFAVLIVLILLCTATLSPQYCWWLCPFKAVSEFEEISSITTIIQTAIFIILFAGLVIVLPLLSKKRTQCSYLCPFGAMQSVTNKISPVEVRIDTEKCIKCKKCIGACPLFALDDNSINAGRARLTCAKCGKCMDICPMGAINYNIKGTKFKSGSKASRNIFLYTAFIILAAFGSGFIIDAIYKLIRFSISLHLF